MLFNHVITRQEETLSVLERCDRSQVSADLGQSKNARMGQ